MEQMEQVFPAQYVDDGAQDMWAIADRYVDVRVLAGLLTTDRYNYPCWKSSVLSVYAWDTPPPPGNWGMEEETSGMYVCMYVP